MLIKGAIRGPRKIMTMINTKIQTLSTLSAKKRVENARRISYQNRSKALMNSANMATMGPTGAEEIENNNNGASNTKPSQVLSPSQMLRAQRHTMVQKYKEGSARFSHSQGRGNLDLSVFEEDNDEDEDEDENERRCG